MKRIAAALLALISIACMFSSCRGGETVPAPVEVIGGPSEVPSNTEEAGTDRKGIVINELMADNEQLVMGCTDDWVELYNPGGAEADLSKYFLIKSSSADKRLSLEGMTIPANGYLVIKLTDEAPFRLSKDGDGLLLVSGDTIIDRLDYDASIGTDSISHEGICEHPTPGFANTEEGYLAYLETIVLPALVINEVVSSNSRYMPVEGEYYDLVEIMNTSDSDVELSDYYLSDKGSELKRYRFPQMTLPAGGYFVVYCSGKDLGPEHAPFKISSSGETLYLSTDSGLVDRVIVPGDLKKDESYGRSGGAFVYMSEVTMGSANREGHAAALAAPAASVPTGAYDEPFKLTLSGEGEIRYTLDGTEPGASSKLYSEPIEVNGITSIRAVCMSGERVSDEVSFFYLVNIEHAYPVINVAIKQEYLTGSEGVLNHVDPEYEHEAFVTMMDHGELCFSVPCGFKLHGNDSKKGEKQNFQLRFREEYGMSKLEYKVFDDREATVFNSLLLKGGSEDYPFCNFRDELTTGLADGVSALSTQAYRPVILYLAGEYRGIYWLRERYDAEYCAVRLGVSADSINLLKDYGGSVVKGSGRGFADLISYCKSHDLRNEEDYQYVMSRIDYLSMMDWYIFRSYVGDVDLANGRFYSSTEDDGRWHWCFFDLDWAFWNNKEDPIGRTARDDGHHEIILALFKNPEFKDMFIKRYAKMMKAVLNEETILKRIDEFEELLRPEIKADREKYGFSVESWEKKIDALRDYVRNGARDKVVLEGIKSYFKLSDDQMMSYFGRTK